MAANLLMAALLNAVTFLVHAVGLIGLTHLMTKIIERSSVRERRWAKLMAMFLLAMGLFLLLSVEIAVWAACMIGIGAFPDFETAFYFSTSSFATIGFGDVPPALEWRLLAAMEGVTGFLIVGWSAAYMVASSIRFGPFERDMHF
ncbi:ion channel [Mesorhizobium sp. AaZ16]|uniref:ion channel n=1 Tax=Mesorhizobium sp. AaZ16 TaxID=3402289 RepID=UPI00374E5F60